MADDQSYVALREQLAAERAAREHAEAKCQAIAGDLRRAEGRARDAETLLASRGVLLGEAAPDCGRARFRCQSGVYIDLSCPLPSDIRIEDIAAGLSRLCRFGGQIQRRVGRDQARWYSVAEHSVHAAAVARRLGKGRDVQRACLLHDAAEAYLGDMTRPVRQLALGRLGAIYASYESRMLEAIARAFDVDFVSTAADVRQIDNALLIAERDRLFDADGVDWTGESEVMEISFDWPIGMAVEHAEQVFLSTFEDI